MSSKFPCVTPWVERFSLELCQAVKKCRKCILEVGCMGVGEGEGGGLDCECIEFVIVGFFLFFSYFGGREGSWRTLFF